MKFRLWIPLYALIVLLFFACSKDEDNADNQIQFHVTISDIEAYHATATITHNGTNRDRYRGFFVEGHVDDVQGEINKYIASAKAASELNYFFTQRKKVVRLNGLRPRKHFTYIVFGLDTQGQQYGEPGVAEFTTTGSQIIAKENPNWKVTYKGHTVYNDWDYSLINVNIGGEVEERFFLAVYEPSKPNAFSSVEDFIFQAIDDFTEEKNTEGDNDFWLDASQVRTESTNFYRYLQPGDYVAYAIGLNADGSPTGSFAKCDPFHVDQYPYTEMYASLVNDDWHFVDLDDKWYFVTFKPNIVNRSLTMSGWGNYDEFEINVKYDRNTNDLSISSARISNGNVTLHFSDGDETGIVYLYGAYYNAEEKLKWTSQSHVIAKGKLSSSGNYSFTPGYYVTLDSDGNKATKLGMSFVMYHGSSPYCGFARMMFPFVLAKSE